MQATLTYNRPRHIPGIGIMIFALLVVVGLTMSHAITKHGEDAQRVNDCMDNQGPLQEWHNIANNHTIYLCEIEPGIYGLDILAQINGRWERITSFIKSKMNRLDQVENYLRNSGAVRVK